MENKEKQRIKETGQEMYFNKEIAKLMIKREENIRHISTAQVVENIVLSEVDPREGLNVAELGAGAHPKRYSNLFRFLQENQGKLYWIDQSSIMLNHAKEQVSDKNIEFIKEEMVSYLKTKKNKFDALILKYSFNYLISVSLEDWLKIMCESLRDRGMVVATLDSIDIDKLYKKGLGSRSFNAIYMINSKSIPQGYKIKHGEVIEIRFLKKAGDISSNPETFADTKIIYYSPEKIKEAAESAGFSEIFLIPDWAKNKRWLNRFRRYYPDSNIEDIITKFILFLRK